MSQSHTAHIMDHIELIGGRRSFGLAEQDIRPIPQQADIEAALSDISDILLTLSADSVLEDDIEDIISSWTTSLHFLLKRIERQHDDAADSIRELTNSFDGSEVKDLQLQSQQNLAQSLDGRSEVIETMREVMAAIITGHFGTIWHPPAGNHVSRHRQTSSIVTAKSYLAAADKRNTELHLPQGTKIGFAGGKEFQDIDRIWQTLDKVKTRYPDIVLVHGNAPGAELIASKWADSRGVTQILCKPDWKAHGKAAPFRRNDEMLKLGLHGIIACAGTGITDNLVDKANGMNIKVMKITS